ncbi:hypothetical protein HET69_12945 [Streptomyces sp. CJ_13]|uniref:hypothetical protein n=1 Tax=Streptomyces sp. CJ_13 TaxID=2724943 RepID=UPI001BDCC635|nr:hypothetical protein [Streptomyces sp. CJ_13]MBT1184907.1 hypothetical protein [Streptomyces sp. CJ_13]
MNLPKQDGGEIRLDSRTPDIAFVRVTPAMARVLLDERNHHNRRLVPLARARHAKAMRDKRFVTTGDTLKFGHHPNFAWALMIDGQHRLAAIVDSGQSFMTGVAVGIDHEAQQYTDTGRPRKVHETLGLNGEANSTKLETLSRWVYRLQHEGTVRKHGGGRDSLSGYELIDFIEANPMIRDCVTISRATYRKFSGAVSLPTLGCVWWHIATADQTYPALADEYFQRITDGTGLAAVDPVYLLRERIHANAALKGSSKPSPHQQFCLLVEVFNAWVQGRTMKRLPPIAPDSPLPEVTHKVAITRT